MPGHSGETGYLDGPPRVTVPSLAMIVEDNRDDLDPN